MLLLFFSGAPQTVVVVHELRFWEPPFKFRHSRSARRR